MAEILDLMQYCPTVDDLWNAYVTSGVMPTTGKPNNFLSGIMGPDVTFVGSPITQSCANIFVNGSFRSTPYCLFAHMTSVQSNPQNATAWPNGYISQITGTQFAAVNNNKTQSWILMPAGCAVLMNGTTPTFFPVAAPNYLCTYFSGNNASNGNIQLHLPVIPLVTYASAGGIVGPSNIASANSNYIKSLTYADVALIFWKKIVKQNIEWLVPAYFIKYASNESTQPSVFSQIYNDSAFDELLEGGGAIYVPAGSGSGSGS